jgi:hypothetical protein
MYIARSMATLKEIFVDMHIFVNIVQSFFFKSYNHKQMARAMV